MVAILSNTCNIGGKRADDRQVKRVTHNSPIVMYTQPIGMIYTLTLNPAIDRQLTVPSLALDTVLRATHMRMDWGGKGFNVSRMLKNLGTESLALGFLAGKAGEMLRDGLDGLELQTDLIWLPGETRTNLSVVTPAGEHYFKVNEPGPIVGMAQQQALLRKVNTLAREGDWWILAGSLPPGLPIDFYAQVIEILKTHGAHTILDTSGEALRLGCLAGPSLLKPNAEEARELTGQSVDSIPDALEAALKIRSLGPEVVVVSLGHVGALFHNGELALLARSPQIREKNPIGAGDALIGGLVWGLSQGFALSASLSWGVACGAATASLDGTGFAQRSLVESLLQDAVIQNL